MPTRLDEVNSVSDWKVVVADSLSAEGLEILRAHADVRVFSGMSPEELLAELPGTHALVVRSATKVTESVLEAASELLVVGRAGIGVDNVDIQAASERGIAVMNTPESGATTTGEHAVAMLCALARNIPQASAGMHAGRWEKKKLQGVEMTGKTVGIVGLGRIGQVVAERCRGLKMRVLAHDPGLPKDAAPEGVQLVTFERLLGEADFVSLHLPLLDATHHLFDAGTSAQMKEGARLVHCARGGIVDERALLGALESGRLAGAALDVFEAEPLPAESPLAGHPKVILTPHIGASTKEASRNVARDMAQQIVTCLQTGIVINGINVPRIPPNQADELAPWLDLASTLGSFLAQAFPGKLERVSLDLQGDLPQRHENSLRIAALVGALRGSGVAVTSVNAERHAAEHKIDCDSQRRLVDRAYVDLVRIEAVLDGHARFITGTLLGRRGLTILEIENASLDAHPSPEMILTFHDDSPGVIGRIGSVLGERSINISSMQVAEGRHSGAGAMALLSLNGAVDEAMLADLEGLDALHRVVRISLERGTQGAGSDSNGSGSLEGEQA